MALDPSIILQGRPPQIDTPMQTMQGIYQLQGMQQMRGLRQQEAEANTLELEQKRRALGDDEAIRQSLMQNPKDPDAAVDWLRTNGHGQASMKLQTEILGHRTKVADEASKTLDNIKKQGDIVASLLGGATDQDSYAKARDQIRSSVEQTGNKAALDSLDALLPEQYDKTKVATAAKMFSDRNTQVRMAADAAREAHWAQTASAEKTKDMPGIIRAWTSSVGRQLSLARNQQEWDQTMEGFRHQIPRTLKTGDEESDDLQKVVLGKFDQKFSPESVRRASSMTMTPEEAANLGIRQQSNTLRERELDLTRRRLDEAEKAAGSKDVNWSKDRELYKDYVREFDRTHKADAIAHIDEPDYQSPEADDFATWRQANVGRGLNGDPYDTAARPPAPPPGVETPVGPGLPSGPPTPAPTPSPSPMPAGPGAAMRPMPPVAGPLPGAAPSPAPAAPPPAAPGPMMPPPGAAPAAGAPPPVAPAPGAPPPPGAPAPGGPAPAAPPQREPLTFDKMRQGMTVEFPKLGALRLGKRNADGSIDVVNGPLMRTKDGKTFRVGRIHPDGSVDPAQ